MAITDQERDMLEYLQNSYPRGLRAKADDENSLVRKYDYTRAYAIVQHIIQREIGVNNLLVTTADADGVTEREKFLKVPVNTSLSLATRKARLLARLAGNSATIKNLKAIIETYLQPNEYELIELWTLPSFVAGDTRTYAVNVLVPISGDDYTELQSILTGIQPAHCVLLMGTIASADDVIGVSESVDTAFTEAFIWAIAGSPAGTDAVRASETAPLTGSYWS